MENNQQKKKHLFVFDFDHTILSDNSDIIILNLLSTKGQNELSLLEKTSKNWAHHMKKVYLKMKEENITLESIKDIIDNIPFNSGYSELFTLLQNNKESFDTLIISGANTLFLKWVLEKNDLVELFPIYYSNWAEPNDDVLIKIEPHHTHSCESCDGSQCKKLILQTHLNNIQGDDYANYSTILYAGDGSNDYCVATLLRQNDVLFPRVNFPLYNMLYTKGYLENLKCEVYKWDDAFTMIEVVNKLLE